MANPPTKNNLESSHFLGFNRAVQDRLTNCLRSDAHNIRPFSTPSEAIQAIKEGLNKVQPRIPGMKQITADGQNIFGQQTRDAVLAYKAFNGIIRQGQPLDPIVGRGTLARLDTELKNLGGAVNPPPPPVLEFGSRNWRFTFFGNKGVFGKGIYSFFIGSTELQDSQNFAIDEVFTSGNLVTGFKGETKGTFTTAKKMLAKDFIGGVCDFSVTRFSQTLQGNFRIEKIVDSGVFSVSFLLPRFRDEGFSIEDGTLNVRGQLRKS